MARPIGQNTTNPTIIATNIGLPSVHQRQESGARSTPPLGQNGLEDGPPAGLRDVLVQDDEQGISGSRVNVTIYNIGAGMPPDKGTA